MGKKNKVKIKYQYVQTDDIGEYMYTAYLIGVIVIMFAVIGLEKLWLAV